MIHNNIIIIINIVVQHKTVALVLDLYLPQHHACTA
jgi:hypothetical protein